MSIMRIIASKPDKKSGRFFLRAFAAVKKEYISPARKGKAKRIIRFAGRIRKIIPRSIMEIKSDLTSEIRKNFFMK